MPSANTTAICVLELKSEIRYTITLLASQVKDP